MKEKQIRKIVREELLREGSSYETGDFVESIVTGLDSQSVYQTDWNEFVIDMSDGPRKNIRISVDASENYVELEATGGYNDSTRVRRTKGIGGGTNEARKWVMNIIRSVPNK